MLCAVGLVLRSSESDQPGWVSRVRAHAAGPSFAAGGALLRERASVDVSCHEASSYELLESS